MFATFCPARRDITEAPTLQAGWTRGQVNDTIAQMLKRERSPDANFNELCSRQKMIQVFPRTKRFVKPVWITPNAFRKSS